MASWNFYRGSDSSHRGQEVKMIDTSVDHFFHREEAGRYNVFSKKKRTNVVAMLPKLDILVHLPRNRPMG